MKAPTKTDLIAALEDADRGLGFALQVACLCKGRHICSLHKAWAHVRDVLSRVPSKRKEPF